MTKTHPLSQADCPETMAFSRGRQKKLNFSRATFNFSRTNLRKTKHFTNMLK
jgi:hypothetical protein